MNPNERKNNSTSHSNPSTTHTQQNQSQQWDIQHAWQPNTQATLKQSSEQATPWSPQINQQPLASSPHKNQIPNNNSWPQMSHSDQQQNSSLNTNQAAQNTSIQDTIQQSALNQTSSSQQTLWENSQPNSTQTEQTNISQKQNASKTTQSTTNNWVPVVPARRKKKWSKISPMKFAIGCALFGLLLVGWVSLWLFYALQNPNQFQWIIGIEWIKTGLQLFAWLFFGLLFLGFFIFTVFNLYKIISKKTRKKIRYVIGLIVWAIFLWWTVAAWITSFNKINDLIEISGSNKIMTAYIPFKWGYRPTTEGFPIIAPTAVSFNINNKLLQRFLNANFNDKIVNSIELDCWNEKQLLPYRPNVPDWQVNIAWHCLYMNKGTYTITMIITTEDKKTGVKSVVESTREDIIVTSEVKLRPSEWSRQTEIEFNDDHDEIIIGRAPTKLYIDSNSIFNDLKLDEYRINWDLNGDGSWDEVDITSFSHQFREAKKQTIYYSLPWYRPDLIYQFDLNILQSNVPVCTLIATPDGSSSTRFRIDTFFDDTDTRINSFKYQVRNINSWRTLDGFTDTRGNLVYDFKIQGMYVVELEYRTDDNRAWYCESDTISVGKNELDISYDLDYREIGSDRRHEVDTQWRVKFNNNTLTTEILPIQVQLTLHRGEQDNRDITYLVKLGTQIIQSNDDRTYTFTLYKDSKGPITIEAINNQRNTAVSTSIDLVLNQDPVIWTLEVYPDSVGNSPFEVTLDASAISLTDDSDSIEMFDRDYGDGEINKNISRATMKHTYKYDTINENWTFTPKVSITSKKWTTATIVLDKPILVKRPNIEAHITIDSHPAQIAGVGDMVEFSLHTDWDPIHISRDFWENKKHSCDNRSCTTISMMYHKEATYDVTAVITYRDGNVAKDTVQISIIES